jgi:membrane protein implicated in regulation of membrane protease activity
MAQYIYWFILALILLGLEMASGTFYLLVLSIAMAVGGIAALLGGGLSTQLALAALAGIVGIYLLRRWKGANPGDVSNQNLDIGQAVKVLNWHDDGSARVFFRGAEWNAEFDPPDATHEGTFYIKDVRGSILILSHTKPV